MTDGAKKEQKKALKKIKTTIQKTGSRLAAAGTAAASRQQSKKTHTANAGKSRNPNPAKKSTAEQRKSQRYLKKDLDAVNFAGLSANDRNKMCDSIAKSINAWFPKISLNESTRMTIPVDESINVYYELRASGNLTNGQNGEIALTAEQQKLLFDSFTTSTGITEVEPTFTKDGKVIFSGGNNFGDNHAALNIVLDNFENKISAEYEVTSEVKEKGKVTTVLGMEKDMNEERFKNPALEFANMNTAQKAVTITAVVVVIGGAIYLITALPGLVLALL